MVDAKSHWLKVYIVRYCEVLVYIVRYFRDNWAEAKKDRAGNAPRNSWLHFRNGSPAKEPQNRSMPREKYENKNQQICTQGYNLGFSAREPQNISMFREKYEWHLTKYETHIIKINNHPRSRADLVHMIFPDAISWQRWSSSIEKGAKIRPNWKSAKRSTSLKNVHFFAEA